MKTTTVFLLSLIACFNLFAQDRAARSRTTTTTTTVPMEKAPVEQQNRRMDSASAPMYNGALGNFSQTWTLSDGTKVTNTFDLGREVAMSKPMNPGAKAKKQKVQERNQQDSSDDEWDCITKETRITLDNDDYLTVDNLDQAANLYPGAIYKFDNYVNGSWKAETGERNPITISTPATGVIGHSFETIGDPNKYSIRDGINTLTGRFTGTANGAFKMKAEEVTSQADANLKIGASGYGFGFSASYLFNMNTSERKKYFLIDCTQELFTIDTDVPNGGFFQTAGRQSKDMMYVGSVTYGVRVLASIETTIATREVAHQFEAAYSGLVAGGSGGLDAYMKNLNEHTVIKMYVVGGPQQGVYPAFNQAELISVIQGIFKNGTYASAQPIKYTFRNMEGAVVSSNSATDYFITRNCTPKVLPEKKPDYLYTVNLWNIRRGDDDDWQLYGQIWAQVYDAQGHEIGSVHGNDRLFDIREENHLSEQEGISGYTPNLEVTFKIPGELQAGATMTVWYWLNDYDGGSGNDFLSMRGGNKGKYKNGDFHFFRRIPLDDLKPASNTSQKRFTDTFTDSEGDSFTEVSGNVTCQQGQ